MEPGSETFVVEFFVLPSFLQEADWESACWDHALKLAHEAGKIPVGPILIQHEIVKAGVNTPLVEGVPMMLMPLIAQDVVRIRASCMIGAEV